MDYSRRDFSLLGGALAVATAAGAAAARAAEGQVVGVGGAGTVHLFDFIPAGQHASILAGTADYDSIGDMERAVSAASYNPAANAVAAGRIVLPAGRLQWSRTLHLKKTVRITGQGAASISNNGDATIVEVAAGASGIVVHRFDTNANGVEDPPTQGADATLLENFALRSLGGTAGHGIWLHARAAVRDVSVAAFPGNGVHIVAGSNAAGQGRGNANCWFLQSMRIRQCGENGVFVNGSDANAGIAMNVLCASNGRWGFWDSSFLGNAYFGCLTDGNGTRARVFHAGNRYVSVREARSATVEPGSDATVWWPAGVAKNGATAAYPEWTAGTAYPDGGGYRTDNINQQTCLYWAYNEGGQPCEFAARTTVFGGTIAAGALSANNRGTILYGTNDALAANKLQVLQRAASGGRMALSLFADAGALLTFEHADLTPTPLRLAVNDADGTLTLRHANSANDQTFAWTLDRTRETFGRGKPVPHAMFVDRLFVGAGDAKRRIFCAAAAPQAGDWARGDLVWNSDPVPGGEAGWICTAAGSPGAWTAFGNTALQASAPTGPLALPAGAEARPATLKLAGATPGDFVEASFTQDLKGAALRAWVSGAGTVAYAFANATARAIALDAGTVRVRVSR